MARRNKKINVKMYWVVVDVVQPVKRTVISVEVENTAGMFISMSMVEIRCSLRCDVRGSLRSSPRRLYYSMLQTVKSKKACRHQVRED